MRRSNKRTMLGRGAIWNFIKKAVGYLKRNKIISRGAAGLSTILPPQYAGVASTVGKTAGTLGFGRRRMPRRRMGYGLRLSGS
jgi:hypothetical protein